ncbi:MAG TPA: ABC transporter permease [Ilumatobacteraceae bacterium]|nr:ABC transporter permease [Ilumatobacteraceae bacterium]
MRLALRELRRRPGRFTTATVILTLIAILLMFLGGLLDGLIASSTGAIRAQNADAIVYSDTAQASFVRSRIDPELRAVVEAVEGVSEVGGIGNVQLGARIPGNGPRDLAGVALFGYELAPDGVPEAPPFGQAWADETLQADGVEEGMTIEIGPARTPIEIIGFVRDTSFNGQASLWASPDTWRDALSANRPDAQLGPGVFQGLIVRGTGDDLPAAIDAATEGATDSYSVDDAVAAIPGVSEQTATFNQIIGVTVAIALVVIGLFFALLTVERTSLYGVLKALGAKSSTIFAGLVAQAVVVTAIATFIAGTLVVLLDVVLPPGSIPLLVTPGRLGLSVVLLLVAAVLGCAFSLRRVLRIDPASAIGTTS